MSDAGQTGITWWRTISHAQQTADLFSHPYVNLVHIKLFVHKVCFVSALKTVCGELEYVLHNT